MRIIFLNATQKISPENSLPLPRNRKNLKRFQSVMTLVDMYDQSQNHSTVSLYGFGQL